MKTVLGLIYWGNNERYHDLLRQWLTWYENAGSPMPVIVLTDSETVLPEFIRHLPSLHCSLADWGPIDENYVFDRKGAICCSAITALPDHNILVVDADAFVRKDPMPLLEPFKDVPFAMPEDFGAMNLCLRNKAGVQTKTTRRCAGVLWFGPGDRSELVRLYREAHSLLCSGAYQEQRHLYEQHAWAVVAHIQEAPFLPRTLNWADQIPRFGPNEDAAIYHRIGHRKWRKPSTPLAQGVKD